MASIRKRGSVWYVSWREGGRQIERRASKDKSVAKQILRATEVRLDKIKAGILDPQEARQQEAQTQPVLDHLKDWHQDLLARGKTVKYADQQRDRVERLTRLGSIQRLSGLTLSGITESLAQLRQNPGRGDRSTFSDRTVNHYVRAAKAFTRWLWRDGRTQNDLLAHLPTRRILDAHTRQALDPDQIQVLITHTLSRPRRSGLSGLDRAMMYGIAFGTGFRANEIKSLVPESFNLDADPPTITCLGAYTKNKLLAVQPIRPELADMLRPWLAGKTSGRSVVEFRGDVLARMIRGDMKAAGLDPGGFDFHSLRHSYVTAVVKSGCSVKVAQELARHSDPKLTLGVYSHLEIRDLGVGLAGLAANLPAIAEERRVV